MRAYVHLLRKGTSSINSLFATAQVQQQQQQQQQEGSSMYATLE
jgi:hypothetical protein